MGRPKLPPRKCSIDGCDEVVRARGWCNVHYRRWRRHGDPNELRVIHGDVEARFWSNVTDTGACWVWTGAVNQDGYGLLGIGGTRTKSAHRWSYEQFVSPVPEGLQLDHLCRVRNCVNPEHLEPVTAYENQHRSPITTAGRTSCPSGHPYDEANTKWVLVRVCRACDGPRQARQAAKSRQRKRKT